MQNSLIIIILIFVAFTFGLFVFTTKQLFKESKEQKNLFLETLKVIQGYSENGPISDDPLPMQEEQDLVDLGDTDPNTLLNYLKKKKEQYED